MAGRSTLEQFATPYGGLCEQPEDAHEAQDDDDPNNGGGDEREVATKDGTTVTRHGTPGRRGGAPAVVSKPGEPARTFAWKLTETIDRFANAIRYGYGVYGGEWDGHRWQQPLRSRVGYVGYGDPAALPF